jgi:hypothetical protein
VSGVGSSGAGFRFTSAMHTAPIAATAVDDPRHHEVEALQRHREPAHGATQPAYRSRGFTSTIVLSPESRRRSDSSWLLDPRWTTRLSA